jgi:hypothetical protein
MCISLDLGRMWPNEVYVDGVYHHTTMYVKYESILKSIWLYLFYILLS